MGRVYMCGNQVIDIKVNSKMTIGMAMVKCIGVMAQVSKANG